MRTDGVESAWMYVYTELLNPILQSLADPVEHVPSVLESELLTHLPLRCHCEDLQAVAAASITSNASWLPSAFPFSKSFSVCPI